MYSVVLIFCFLGYISGELHCQHKKPNIPTEWIDMVHPCTKKMAEHVKAELGAAVQYLAMGAHFSKDTVNRPGLANLFFNAASEERDHAMKFIGYLLMRGGLTEKVRDLINQVIVPEIKQWDNGISALRDALKLEAKVTKKIRDVMMSCEDNDEFNDYHLVDYLTGEFLEEQYNGQRDLAGKISTLDKMMDKHGALGEFLFDKKLLG